MRLYDKVIACLKKTTDDIKELKSILRSKPTPADELTTEEQNALQVEFVRFMLTIKEFGNESTEIYT